MTLIRRIPRQVARHLARYLSLVLLIALGSIALITLNLVKDTLQFSFDRLSESGQVEDVRAWLATEPANLESLGHFYQVEIEPRTSLDLELPDDVTLRVFDRSERVDKPIVLRGRDIRNDHEMLLNPSFAAAQGLVIGDQLILPEGNWRICGFFTMPDYIYPTQHETDLMADISHFGIAIISKPAMEYLIHTVDLTDQEITMDKSYGIRYRPGNSAIKEQLKDRYGLVRWLESKDNARINMVKSEIAGIREMTAPYS
jgi:putative ABC transport system permease protein